MEYQAELRRLLIKRHKHRNVTRQNISDLFDNLKYRLLSTLFSFRNHQDCFISQGSALRLSRNYIAILENLLKKNNIQVLRSKLNFSRRHRLFSTHLSDSDIELFIKQYCVKSVKQTKNKICVKETETSDEYLLNLNTSEIKKANQLEAVFIDAKKAYQDAVGFGRRGIYSSERTEVTVNNETDPLQIEESDKIEVVFLDVDTQDEESKQEKNTASDEMEVNNETDALQATSNMPQAQELNDLEVILIDSDTQCDHEEEPKRPTSAPQEYHLPEIQSKDVQTILKSAEQKNGGTSDVYATNQLQNELIRAQQIQQTQFNVLPQQFVVCFNLNFLKYVFDTIHLRNFNFRKFQISFKSINKLTLQLSI